MRLLPAGLLALWCIGAAAQTATPDDTAQRERIAAERAAVQSRHDDTVRACAAEFAVTACINRAAAQRRAAMEALDREQAALDASARERRAAERTRRVEDKQRAAAARAAAQASAPVPETRTPRPPPAPASGAKRTARPTDAQARAAESAAAAARRRIEAERRREKAEAHAEEVMRRNAERAARKPPAAPLPPASAALR
jgi:colicin import membrane protein